jgi:signal transduction histidine kinase
VLDQLEMPRWPECRVTNSNNGEPMARRVHETASGVPAAPPKLSMNRPQQLLELVGRVTRAAWGGIGLLSQGEWAGYLTFGISDQAAAGLARAPWFIPLIRHIHEHPRPLSLKDVAAPGLVPGDCPPHFLGDGLPPLGSFLGVALNSPGLYQGALYLMRSPEQEPFDAEAEALALSICGWLEQWRLLDEMHLLTRLRLLNQVAQAATGSLDLERIIALALGELDRHIPLQIGAVWLMIEADQSDMGVHQAEGARLVLSAASAAFAENLGPLGLETGLSLAIQETPFATCLLDGQAVYSDLRRSVERNSSLADNLAKGGATAFFAVPLRAGDRTIGVLQSICTRPSGFTQEQIQLLYLVADLLGPAIYNCRLFERLRGAYEELRRTQAHLIHAEKMRALGQLAAGMAHDFNNSLCAVLGFLELTLLEKDLPEHCRQYLESSRTCTLDAAQTVHRVQDFARWQKNELLAEFIDPNALVQQTLELSRHKWDRLALAGKGSIQVEQQTEATARVKGNVAELREVLTNLIFNAVDAMPQGGTLMVRTWSTARDVFLSVQDTGVGIADSVRRRLFEPFFTSKGERGNGLGLSVSFGIVQRHHGEITVESAPSCGSTFMVRLPAAAETAAAGTRGACEKGSDPLKPKGSDPFSQAPHAPAGKSLRVLIVEDEESIRRFLAAGLTQLGHQPRLTSHAEEALAAFAEEPFDVVLTDLGLPGVSGEEVARQIAERAPDVPVVLLTGWADQIKADKKPVAGVKYILGKPITLTTLANTLTALCGG